MAQDEHLAILKHAVQNQDISIWNLWRKNNPFVYRDLREADLHSADLSGANLSGADLTGANLSNADLSGADLSLATLNWANLHLADLRRADLSAANLTAVDLNNADLRGADLSAATFHQANLSGADLRDAHLIESKLIEVNLRGASLIGADFTDTMLDGCSIYGISAWDIKLNGTIQHDLNISPYGVSRITMDDLEVAQFVYLLLNNNKIRDVVTTITCRAVLILGKYSPDRRAVLSTIQDELRKRDLLPIFFDFRQSVSHTRTDTVRQLMRLSHFVIADLTEPDRIPDELTNIVPELSSVPVQPIIRAVKADNTAIDHLKIYDWMLSPYTYESQEMLIVDLADKVIQPAQDKADDMKPMS